VTLLIIVAIVFTLASDAVLFAFWLKFHVRHPQAGDLAHSFVRTIGKHRGELAQLVFNLAGAGLVEYLSRVWAALKANPTDTFKAAT